MSIRSIEVSTGYERLTIILSELISVMKDRPDDALLLMKDAWAEFQALPVEDQELINQTFQFMAAEMDKKTKLN